MSTNIKPVKKVCWAKELGKIRCSQKKSSPTKEKQNRTGSVKDRKIPGRNVNISQWEVSVLVT